MKTVQLEIQNNLFNEFMKWLYSHSQNDFNIKYVNEINPRYDESGIEYMDKEEQREIEEMLQNPECHEISHSKIIQINI
ncbi:MAG: hypothetical protein QM493_00610 [Sulfurovum sp.]